jgi:sugar O-acyltransferase (sialic acid O-acetyltransferase NeuD family)
MFERNSTKMKKRLIIIGASGHGKVVADIAEKMGKWQEFVFLDDNKSKKICGNFKVIGATIDTHKYVGDSDFFVAVGDNLTREKIQEKLQSVGASIVTLVHPSAVIAGDVDIGIGTAIMAGVVINSATIIGKGCIINTNASLDHDNILGDYVHISPGVNIAGSVKIGHGTWIGIGASVINNIEISAKCMIGAGAVVTSNIVEKGIYVGMPAKLIKPIIK